MSLDPRRVFVHGIVKNQKSGPNTCCFNGMEEKENVIEWVTGDDVIGVTVTQKKFINKILKLKEKHPDLVEIVGDNLEIDGSLYARLPLRALHLSIINGKPRPDFKPTFGRK